MTNLTWADKNPSDYTFKKIDVSQFLGDKAVDNKGLTELRERMANVPDKYGGTIGHNAAEQVITIVIEYIDKLEKEWSDRLEQEMLGNVVASLSINHNFISEVEACLETYRGRYFINIDRWQSLKERYLNK